MPDAKPLALSPVVGVKRSVKGFQTVEALERRFLMSVSNALDEIDFGTFASESSHNFDVGFSSLPLAGVGALNQTYRAPVGGGPTVGTNNDLQFTLAVSPTLQNYITIKLWGGDTTPSWINVSPGDESDLGVVDSNNNGGPAPDPNRFYYDTFPIPITSTTGQTSLQLTLYETNTNTTTYYGRPIYSAYTTTNPDFIPASNAATGTPVAQTGQITSYTALTSAQVLGTTAAPGILLANRQSIYGSGGYYSQTLADMITPSNAPNAPPEVMGLDLWTNVAAWVAANPNATADQWRDQVGGGAHGGGYSTTPEPLLSLLSSTYVLQPFTDMNGNAVSGLDYYHNATVLQELVSVLDGTTYLQASDGGIQNDGPTPNIWQGLTSTPRATGHGYAGSTARGGGWSLSLEGVDDQSIGEAIITILNDPTGASAFETYLGQSYDANLTSKGYNTGLATSVLRATAYEEMLYNNMNYLLRVAGGTESQSMFEESGMYADQIALEKLQALYPNSSYPAQTPDTALNIVEQIMGLVPFTFTTAGPGGNPGGGSNYGLTSAGLGEAGGENSSGYDGRYGQILPDLAPDFAQLVQLDPGLTSSSDHTVISQIIAASRKTIDAYDQFISPGEDFNGITDGFVLTQEDFITYRDPYNPNSDGFHFTLNAQYPASDPSAGINDADALRSAYLTAEYLSATSQGDVNYGRGLANYEDTLRALINVNPSTLTSLPGEPGQPNYAWADVQNGAVSAYYDGERFYLNTNWRNSNGNLGTPSEIARVHDTTATIDKAATIVLPYNSATVQSDGNLSSTSVGQPWFVRYGNWLCAFNNNASSTTVKLPSGFGSAVDVLTNTIYAAGTTSITLPAGHSLVLYLVPPVVIQPIPNGTYLIDNGTSHNVLGDPNSSTSAGTRIDQEPISASAGNQQWIFTSNGNGYYTIQNVASGLYLDNPSGQNSSGIVLDQAAASNAGNQLWQVVPRGSNYALVNAFSGLVVNDPLFSTASAAGQDLETSTGNQNQAFSIIPVPASTQPIPNGIYTLTGAQNGLVMDEQSSIIQNTFSQTSTSQQWIFAYKGSGYYAIQNVATKTFISGLNGGLSLAAATGGNEQLWYLSRTGAGFEISCKLGQGIIDDSGNSNTAGNQLVNYTAGTGGLNETWVTQLYVGINSVPTPVTGTSTTLVATVSTDSITAAGLLYTWSATGQNSAAVAFSPNGTNASSITTATFIKAGIYTFTATVTNGTTFVNSGTTTVTVNQTPTGLLIAPPTTVLNDSQTMQFSGSVVDQFGVAIPIQPTITFSLGSGSVGTITSAGLYTASAANGSATIVATASSGPSTSVAITITNVTPAAPTNLAASAVNAGQIQLTWIASALAQTYNVLRSNTANGTYTTIATGISATQYLDTLLSANTTYYYFVQAVNGSASPSVNSNQAHATTSDATDIVPLGSYIGTSGAYNNGTNIGANAFDGSLATYFDGPDNSGDWVGLDFGAGNGAFVDTIKYCPRSTYPQRMTSGVFQGSSSSTFTSGVVNLYTISAQPAQGAFTSVAINSTTPFRYLRYIGPANSNCDVAEIEFDGYTVSSTTPPTIATAISATPNPSGTMAVLSVLGNDAAGQASLQYSWTVAGPGSVSLSANNTNAASTTTATFSQSGTYTIAVTITDPAGLSITTTTSLTVTFGLFTNSLDIGGPLPAGSVLYNSSNTTYTVQSGGSDIWNSSDQFHYDYSAVSGNATIIAEVNSETNTNVNAKAGIMIRNGLDAGAAEVMIAVTPTNGITFEQRYGEGQSTSQTTLSGIAAPYWFKLVRSGNNFSAYYSASGSTWTQLGGTITVAMNPSVYVGLSDTSHNNGTAMTATFSNVSVTGTAAPLPVIATPPTASPYFITTASTNLSVLGAENGSDSGLTYAWSTTGSVPASVAFSVNGTNAAKNTIATFTQPGVYSFVVTVTDSGGLTVSSSLTVIVSLALNKVVVSPAPTSIAAGATQQFTAAGFDQFGNSFAIGTPSWNATGGAISSAGLFTAGNGGGTFSVTANYGGVSGTASVAVTIPTTYAGTASSDGYYLRLGSDGLTEQIWVGTTGLTGPAYAANPTYSISLASLSALTFSAGGGSDALTVDLSNGSPIPMNGISFTGGAGSNSITILGSSANYGVNINATQIAVSGSSAITYAGTQSILANLGSGNSTLTQSAQPGNGGTTLTLVSPTLSDTLNVNAGTYTFAASAAGTGFSSISIGSLSIGANATVVLNTAMAHTDRTVLGLNALSLTGTAVLDLGGNDLIMYSTPSAVASVMATINQELQTGYNGGVWNGNGIISSAAASNTAHLTALGMMQNLTATSFDNQPVNSFDILLKYTFYGDANLDGKVDGSDYSRIDYGCLAGATGWSNGDFNYDGVINGSDYTLIDNAFNTQGASMAAVIDMADTASKQTVHSKSNRNRATFFSSATPIAMSEAAFSTDDILIKHHKRTTVSMLSSVLDILHS